MGVFDWFRRQMKGTGDASGPGVAAQAPDVPEHLSTSVGVIVEERPAAECRVPAQESAGGDHPAEAAESAAATALAMVPQPAGADREPEGEHDMGLMDTIKQKLAPHHDKVGQGVDKAADMIDEKTGGKHRGQIDKGAEQAKSALGDDGTPEGAQPPADPAAGQTPPEENPPA